MPTASERQRINASPLARLAHEKRERERIARIAEEIRKIEEEKRRKTAAGKRVIGDVKVKEDGRDRTVKKYLTTLDQLERRNHLAKPLRTAFDELAKAVSLSSGACVDDKDLRGSSSRGIGSLENGSAPEFGPRSFSDQILRAERVRQYVMGQIPQDMMRLANQLLDEETGYTLTRPTPLTDYGNAIEFNQEQQARAAGAMMAVDLCRVIHHALKSR